jgi:hypothetical protein
MADAKVPTSGARAEAPRLTGLKKRQQIELAGRNMFIWVVIAAVAVSFCIATGQYLFAKWDYNNRVLGAKYTAIDTLTQNITNAQKLKTEVDSLVANNDLASVKTNANDSNLKSILDALPTVSEPAAMATSLQEVILNSSGVTIETITVPQETVDTANVNTQAPSTPQEMQISFIVSGSYDKIRALMNDLERTIRPIKVSGLSLSGSDANLRATIEATTYYQPSKTVTAQMEVVK